MSNLLTFPQCFKGDFPDLDNACWKKLNLINPPSPSSPLVEGDYILFKDMPDVKLLKPKSKKMQGAYGVKVTNQNLSECLEFIIGILRHTRFCTEKNSTSDPEHLSAIPVNRLNPRSALYDYEWILLGFFGNSKEKQHNSILCYAFLESGMVAANCRLFTNRYLNSKGAGHPQVGALKYLPIPILNDKQKSDLYEAGNRLLTAQENFITTAKGECSLSDLCSPGDDAKYEELRKALDHIDSIVDDLYGLTSPDENDRIEALLNFYAKKTNLSSLLS